MIPIVFTLFLLAFETSATAQMRVMDDCELSEIDAQAGISIAIWDSAARITVEEIRYSDTDPAHIPPRLIEFHDFSIDDGSGNPFSFDTPYSISPPDVSFITMDIGDNAAGDSIMSYNITNYINPRTVTVGSLVFCDQELGSLLIDSIVLERNQYKIGAHDSGVDFEWNVRTDVDNFQYAYQFDLSDTVTASLDFTEIYLAGSASGVSDDPADKNTWEFSGNFQIGDLTSNPTDPATIDLASDAGGNASIFYNLPMNGCIRVGDVNYGGYDFGPIAMDGITVHNLNVQITSSGTSPF